MPDVQGLNQIEYRHHATRDLSPVASSMSPQSRNAWHAQIRAWVRHPHDERLSESACYQVFPNGTAALAWRYWDGQAAERADGSRGRPLVSRVLAGPVSVLSPEAAVVLSRTGPTAALVGVLPGDVLDGAEMPTVSGPAVAALVDEAAPELDEAAMWENGLQAMVAAALHDPSVPLAVSLRDNLISRPLRQCVQCPLLWGLLRVTGPILGLVGRGWSFSTFELPLGDTDTASLPSIIFRRAQDARAAPVNWRKELKVRPIAPDALADTVPYADQVELAGWLVAEYRDRGGNGLAAVLADACGGERTLQGRLEKLHGKIRNEHPVVIRSQGSAYVAVAREPAVLSPAPEKAAAGYEAQAAREPDVTVETVPEVVVSEEATADSVTAVPATSAAPAGARQGPPQADRPHNADWPERPPAALGPASRQVAGIDPGDWTDEARGERYGPGAAATDADRGQAVRAGSPFKTWAIDEVTSRRDSRDAPGLPLSGRPGDVERPVPAPPGQGDWNQGGWPDSPGRPPYVDQSSPAGRQQPEPRARPPYPQPQPYAQPGQPAYRQGMAEQPHQWAQRNMTVSSLLKQLELVGSDPARFRSCLEAIFSLRDVDDPGDRIKSWELISGKYWFRNVSKSEVLQQHELAALFSIVLIPELRRGGVREEAIANWALDVPPEMIAGLLEAVREAGDQRPMVHAILEPVLAVRWVRDRCMEDLWDENWAEAAAEADHRDDKNRFWAIVRLNRKRR